MKGLLIMDINFMKYFTQFKSTCENDILNMTTMVKRAKEHGAITERTFEKCKQYVADVQKEMKELDEGKEKFLSAVNLIENPQHQNVIRERFVFCNKWDDVVENMSLTKKVVQRLFSEALPEFERLLSAT